ncbi:hypothetical protein AB0H82_20635 [Streptomyces sp. NPDC050732]|uniref:YqeB family protein n=1 Tax=Streptomyces sp. NPDC050732 TaxID=3154632 RepID=UPI0034348DE5
MDETIDGRGGVEFVGGLDACTAIAGTVSLKLTDEQVRVEQGGRARTFERPAVSAVFHLAETVRGLGFVVRDEGAAVSEHERAR